MAIWRLFLPKFVLVGDFSSMTSAFCWQSSIVKTEFMGVNLVGIDLANLCNTPVTRARAAAPPYWVLYWAR